jgi:hypothetical protein
MDKIQEVINDPGDGYIVYIQFISINEEKKEVKRAFKLV